MVRNQVRIPIFVIILSVVTACQPLPAPASTIPAQLVATSTPSTIATAPPSGRILSGRVLWGTEPVAGARVELHRPDWRTNPDSLVMRTEADGLGMYALTNPPVGDYEVVPAWPAGVTDGAPLAPGMPVTIAAGQEVMGVDVSLAKKLNLLAPAEGAEVSATPTLRWEAFPNARFYRVVVTDMATMDGFVAEDTPETSLTVAAPLPSGRTLTWVVNALGEGMTLLAVDTREFTVKREP